MDAFTDETEPAASATGDPRDVVRKIGELTADEVDLLDFTLNTKKGDGQRAVKAQALGVTVVSLAFRMSAIYAKIGVPISNGRKRFLRRCLQEFWRSRAAAAPSAHSAREASLSAVPVRAEPAPAQPPAPSAAEPSGGFAPMLTEHGSGLAIPLPATVSGVSVVSVRFRGSSIETLESEISERKQAGLAPAFLVVYSTSDRDASHAHVVFLKHAGEPGA